MRKWVRSGIVAAFALIVIGVMGIVPSASAADSYKFGVSKPGGAWYPIGTALQRLAEKTYGDKITLDIGGGMANALNTLSGKIEFGLTFNSTLADAAKGRGPFKGKDASNLRIAAVQYPQMMVWAVWADSGITHWSQLKGKRVNAMPKRFSAYALNGQMLQALGMSFKNFSKVLTLGFNDAVAQMKDGHIDAYLGPGERQYAPLIQLAAHKPIRILEFTDEDVKKMRKVQPGLVGEVLEKQYYHQSKDVQVVQSYQVIATNKNVSENLVYKMAKLMYSNLEHMKQVNPSFKTVIVKDAARDLGTPIHPGLAKYLKEIGVK